MKIKGIDRVFSVFILLATLIISIICNIGDFTGGSNGEINPFTVAITTIYVVYCSAFSLFSHNKKSIIAMIILGASTLIVAVFGLLISTFRLTIGAIIPFAIVFLSPFQGLVAAMSSNWIVIYSVIIVISILWVLFSIFNLRKHHKIIETNEN
ncbi:MAG: hypothetical protein IJE29_06225 [Firmicutes bacterium]|nr:hypothetical protein [Bacillota bacterium]